MNDNLRRDDMRTNSGTYNVPDWVQQKDVLRLIKSKGYKSCSIQEQPDEGYFVMNNRMVYYNQTRMWVG